LQLIIKKMSCRPFQILHTRSSRRRYQALNYDERQLLLQFLRRI